MESTKYLLIGGGLAALEAAKQIRRIDTSGSVMLVSDESHLPYDRPPLSKELIRGEKSADDLVFAGEGFYEENRIDLVLNTHVKSLDPSLRVASLGDGEAVAYEKVLIATGGSPIKLRSSEGVSRVYYLRTLDDSVAICKQAKSGKRAVIIGAGFIGLEVAASLTQRGVQVAVLEAMPRVWPIFATLELSAYVQRYCEAKGVSFVLNDAVSKIRQDGSNIVVVTESGEELVCDFVCVGIGIRPNVQLAEGAGLRVHNGVVVDESMRTSDSNIYAAGDIANYSDPVFQKRRRVEHWGHAEYTGQLAGKNMAGEAAKYNMLSYVWSDIFDLHLEFAGDEQDYDQTIIRGNLNANSFTILYLKGGCLTAYCSINTDARDFPVFQRLIRRKQDLSGVMDQLTSTATNLRTLV